MSKGGRSRLVVVALLTACNTTGLSQSSVPKPAATVLPPASNSIATIPAATAVLQALTSLTGTVTYLQRAILPRTVVAEVTLTDISSTEAPTKVISVVTITPTIESIGMIEQETFERVRDIIVELLGVDAAKVTPEARFREELEADSLDMVELIMAFEEQFGEEISDQDACKLKTVGDAVTYLQSRVLGTNGRQVSFPFELKYDPAQINPGHRYAVGARIVDGDRLLFVSTNNFPVLTDGSFRNDIEIIVDPVGQ